MMDDLENLPRNRAKKDRLLSLMERFDWAGKCLAKKIDDYPFWEVVLRVLREKLVQRFSTKKRHLEFRKIREAKANGTLVIDTEGIDG